MYGVVYKYTNSVDGKVYVGQTTSALTKRHIQHKCASKRNTGYFYKAVRKHGWDNFIGPIQIDEAENQAELDEKEIHWISQLKSHVSTENGYNLTEGGWGGKLSEKTRRKISESHKGLSHSEATRQIISEKGKGRIVSTETRRKLSIINKTRYIENPASFIPSRETVEKVAMKLRGRKQTPKEREAHRIGALSADRSYMTPEYRQKMADKSKGTERRAMINYKIVHPNGYEETILNLEKYCRENSHCRSNMMQVASGKYSQHHGLKVIRLGA